MLSMDIWVLAEQPTGLQSEVECLVRDVASEGIRHIQVLEDKLQSPWQSDGIWRMWLGEFAKMSCLASVSVLRLCLLFLL